jgi:hypothetical protein
MSWGIGMGGRSLRRSFEEGIMIYDAMISVAKSSRIIRGPMISGVDSKEPALSHCEAIR